METAKNKQDVLQVVAEAKTQREPVSKLKASVVKATKDVLGLLTNKEKKNGFSKGFCWRSQQQCCGRANAAHKEAAAAKSSAANL